MHKAIKTRQVLNILVLSGILIMGSSILAQDAKSFVGDWDGAVDIAGTEIGLVLHFVLDDEGNLTGTIDSPSQGAFGLALADIKVEGKKISFGIDDPNVPGDPQFSGSLDEAGTTISGDFSQGEAVGTFKMEKEVK